MPDYSKNMVNEVTVKKALQTEGVEVVHFQDFLKVHEDNGDLYFKNPSNKDPHKMDEDDIMYCYFMVNSFKVSGRKWGEIGFWITPIDNIYKTVHETETFDEAIKWCINQGELC